MKIRPLHALVAALLPIPIRIHAAYVPGEAFDRFITIWLENQDFVNARENPDIQALAKSGVLQTSYYGLTHPSQPNYIASVAGDYFGLDHDNLVNIPDNVSTVVDLLETKGISWREYMEDAPGPGFMAQGSSDEQGKWQYVRKHNPLINFQNITNNGSRLLNIVSFDDFRRDLQGQALPQFAILSPNMLNDGHNTSLAYSASWAREFLTPLLLNESFMDKTLIHLTWDESETYPKPNWIVSLLLGGAVPSSLKGTKDGTFYTHYSILSTIENNWGLPHLGRYDVGANVFDVVARKTGYQNLKIDTSKVDLSLSYGGFLNSREQLPIPPPNPYLTGPGGQGILQTIPDAWLKPSGGKFNTPYDGSGEVFDGRQDSSPIYKVQTSSSGPGRVARNSVPKGTGTTHIPLSWIRIWLLPFLLMATCLWCAF